MDGRGARGAPAVRHGRRVLGRGGVCGARAVCGAARRSPAGVCVDAGQEPVAVAERGRRGEVWGGDAGGKVVLCFFCVLGVCGHARQEHVATARFGEAMPV